MVLGYIRISTDKQDTTKQKYLILEYAQKNNITIDKFIEIEISSKKTEKERRITELKETLKKDDTLIVAELSRLGRNMLETINLIQELNKKEIKIIFIRQPELSTFNNAQSKLLLAIYSYFAEAERDFISLRTKQGLEAAKASGKKLGRQKGQKIKSKFDNNLQEIRELLLKKVSVSAIHKIIQVGSYVGLRSFILNNKELAEIYGEKK